MKHRMLSLVTALTVLTSCCVVPAHAAANSLDNFTIKETYMSGQYSDVPSTSGFSENVKAGYEYGLMQGYGKTFGIQNNITRLASIIVACRIHSIYTYGENIIDMVYSGTLQEKHLSYAKDHGIIYLFDDYSSAASRAEFAAILSSALPDSALAPINTVDLNAIPDVFGADKYANEIYRLYRAGVLVGSDSHGTFYPQANITRGAACAIATRMIRPELRKTITLQLQQSHESKERLEGAFNYLCYYLYNFHNDDDNSYSYTEYSENGDESWSMQLVADGEPQFIAVTNWFYYGNCAMVTELRITQNLEPYVVGYWFYEGDELLTAGFVDDLAPYELDLTPKDAYLNFTEYYDYCGFGSKQNDQELAALQLLSTLIFLDHILTEQPEGFSIYDFGFYKTYAMLHE